MRHKKILSLFVLLTALFFNLQSHAEMRPVLKNRAGIPPFDILREILATGNRIKGTGAVPQQNSSAAPHITWLADADARVQPEFILTHPDQRVYTVRNLANQLGTSLGAIDYGVLYLHSPILLITGNTDSEAIRLFTGGYADLDQTIRRELDHLYLPLGYPAKDSKEEDREHERRLVEKNVDYQVRQAMERYSDRISNSRLVVVGSVLDIANYYGKGANQLIIININGETDGEKIKKMQLLRILNPKLLANIGRPAALDPKKH
ncbi:MAG: carbonic anhydrase [Proteobacteria bacterium]|nr:carbonic anhydrase [Pseudomonadota bacterium]MBU4295076.1 carbonic anhydrase [Pseudomonadota bacterium]MCG2749975.1 carbonic anhydrase [Desulfobulbaceae bacterium]